MFTICGDFNPRCSNFEDYIVGVNRISERQVADFTSNKYGELLCEFMIDSNCCMLNGRNFLKYNYTCIKLQGISVVDYCIIPHEDLNKYSDFTVSTLSDLIIDLENCNSDFAQASKPDHSVLSWKVKTSTYAHTNENSKSTKSTYTVYDKELPDSFLEKKTAELESFVNQFKEKLSDQADMDNAYSSFIDIIK